MCETVLVSAPNPVRPPSPEEICGTAVSLREAGRLDEAESTIRRAFALYPDNEAILVHRALISEQREEDEEALQRWAALRAAHPSNPYGYLCASGVFVRRGAAAEADGMLQDGLAVRKGDLDILAAYARLAESRGDTGEALKRWAEVKAEHPGSPLGYTGAAKVLIQAGRLGEAEGVLSVAVRSFPDDADTMFTSAWLALTRQDGETGLKRWRSIAERFDDSPGVRVGLANAMRQVGDAVGAETCIAEGIEKFPGDVTLATEFAGVAEQRQDFDVAAQRWLEARTRFGEHASIHSRLIGVLQSAGRLDEAKAALDVARERFPEDAEILRSEALLAQGRQDWDAAFQAWTRFSERYPDNVQAVSGLGAALRSAGRLQDSADFLKGHAEKDPGNLELNYHYGLTLTEQRDWQAALPLWARLKISHGEHASVQGGIVAALWQAKLDLADREAELAQLQPTIAALESFGGDEEKGALIELFSSFESLGDDCEFGMVQRRFGAEPLSLLRWTATPPDPLAEALKTQFEGVGDPEQSELRVVNGEFNIVTPRYLMNAHSFVFESSISADKFFIQQCKRISFLRRKLLEDLQAAEKIFVYKYRHGLTDEQVQTLYAAMLSYSPDSKLLCLKLADDEHPSGTSSKIDRGLVVAYLKHFSTVDICVPDWEKICKATKEMLSPA